MTAMTVIATRLRRGAVSRQVAAACCGLLFAAAAFAAGSSAPAGNDDLDAKLAQARARLEAAARDVAQLSGELSGQLSQQLSGQVGGFTAEGLRRAAETLRTFRTRAVLGLQVEVAPPAKDEGVKVLDVSPGGPAAEAGMRAGDVIVAVNDQPTVGPQAPRDLVEHMTGVQPGSKVGLKVLRDGKPLAVQLVARPVFDFALARSGAGDGDSEAPADGMFGRVCSAAPFMSGVELAPLSPHLGEYFGARQGVLVVHTEQIGILQDGDVIVDIGGRVPRSGAHALRILCSYQPGEKIRLNLMRQKKPMVVDYLVSEPPRGREGHPPSSAPPAGSAPPAARVAPPIVIGPLPSPPGDAGCLNDRGPGNVDPMPGSEVPCIRLPEPRVMPLSIVAGNTG